MENNILYFSALCPDTPPFVAELQRLGIAYEAVDIMERMGALKMFLALRDREADFEAIKAQGWIGIPVLQHRSGALIFRVEDLKNFAESAS